MQTPLIKLATERGRIKLHLCCLRMGNDLCVTLSGGDRPHIGSVALSQPNTSHESDENTSARTSVITLQGHREDVLAKRIAAQVSSHMGSATCVACGIHVDAILPDELVDVLEMSEELTKRLLERLADHEDGMQNLITVSLPTESGTATSNE